MAIALLEDIGALDAEEELTTMGRHLAALPLSPRIGKLLLYAILFGCLDPILTVACGERLRVASAGCLGPFSQLHAVSVSLSGSETTLISARASPC